MSEASVLRDRIVTLERELALRPTKAQLDYVAEYAKRKEALYEAVLARNVILKRRLDEATGK